MTKGSWELIWIDRVERKDKLESRQTDTNQAAWKNEKYSISFRDSVPRRNKVGNTHKPAWETAQ